MRVHERKLIRLFLKLRIYVLNWTTGVVEVKYLYLPSIFCLISFLGCSELGKEKEKEKEKWRKEVDGVGGWGWPGRG